MYNISMDKLKKNTTLRVIIPNKGVSAMYLWEKLRPEKNTPGFWYNEDELKFKNKTEYDAMKSMKPVVRVVGYASTRNIAEIIEYLNEKFKLSKTDITQILRNSTLDSVLLIETSETKAKPYRVKSQGGDEEEIFELKELYIRKKGDENPETITLLNEIIEKDLIKTIITDGGISDIKTPTTPAAPAPAPAPAPATYDPANDPLVVSVYPSTTTPPAPAPTGGATVKSGKIVAQTQTQTVTATGSITPPTIGDGGSFNHIRPGYYNNKKSPYSGLLNSYFQQY